jgi:hypothetical protein
LFEKIKADVQQVEDVLYSGNFTDPAQGYRKYIDVDSFIDWFLVQEISKNVDSRFAYSVYMYYNPDTGKYHMGPVWDFDFAFGNLNYTDAQYAEGFWVKESPQWVCRFFEDPWFVSRVKARWNSKKAEINRIIQFIENRASALDYAQTLNFQRWDILNIYVSPNPNTVLGSYRAEVDFLKSWLSSRLAWLDGAINAL